MSQKRGKNKRKKHTSKHTPDARTRRAIGIRSSGAPGPHGVSTSRRNTRAAINHEIRLG